MPEALREPTRPMQGWPADPDVRHTSQQVDFRGDERDTVPPGTLLAGVGRLQPYGGSDAV